jgi:DNA-binding transcriptional regulator YhcF (GntR family)
MKPIEKPNTLDMVRDALRAEISAGRWARRLPGTRVLALRLGVSAPTVGAALDRLVAEGFLESGGPRRAYRLTEHARANASAGARPRRRQLVILTHEAVGQLVENTRELLEALMGRMAARGWLVRHQVLDFVHVKRPQKTWDRQIGVVEGTKIVAVYGTPSLAEWATRRKIPMLFLGGNGGNFPMPAVAVSSSRMAEEALDRLTSLGHRRIALPLCDRTTEFKRRLKELTQVAVERMGERYQPGYHNPESNHGAPDTLRRILARVFAGPVPTALVLLDWKEVVAAHCFLAERGLRVPRDVSLVMLSDVPTAEWFHPELCRFRFPQKKIISEMIKWLDGRPGNERVARLSGTWVDGGSIGPPPSMA